jgi:hypothetical protein
MERLCLCEWSASCTPSVRSKFGSVSVQRRAACHKVSGSTGDSPMGFDKQHRMK